MAPPTATPRLECYDDFLEFCFDKNVPEELATNGTRARASVRRLVCEMTIPKTADDLLCAYRGREVLLVQILRNVKSRETATADVISKTPEIPADHPGFSVRIVGNNRVTLDPFIAIDDFFTRYPAAFLDHPHRGFESATFILPEQEHPDSKLLYYDSTLGQEEKALGAGGLVRMICGRGISHCEVVEHEEHLMRAINIWFNYTAKQKLCEPWSCVHNMGTKEMPMQIKDGIRTIVLQGRFNGLIGNCFHNCPTKLELVHVTLMPNRTTILEIPSGWNAVVYCINGSGFVNGKKLQCCEGPDHKLATDTSTPTFAKLSINDADYNPNKKRAFRASSPNDSIMEVMYFAGEPIGLPMLWFDLKDDGSSGTFIASTEDEFKPWLQDWLGAKNGFEYRDNWISPGMQMIQERWNGLEQPAQDRDAHWIETHRRSITLLREDSVQLVSSLRKMSLCDGAKAMRQSTGFTKMSSFDSDLDGCTIDRDEHTIIQI